MIFTFTGDCSAVRHTAAIFTPARRKRALRANHRVGFNESDCVNRQLIDTSTHRQFKCNLQIMLEVECLNWRRAQHDLSLSFNDVSFFERGWGEQTESGNQSNLPSHFAKRRSPRHTLKMGENETQILQAWKRCSTVL